MKLHLLSDFPWTIIPALIGFGIGAVVQFRLKYHIDRDKVINIEKLSDLYPNSIPPRKILNEKGRKLYNWLYFGFVVFFLSIFISILLYRD